MAFNNPGLWPPVLQRRNLKNFDLVAADPDVDLLEEGFQDLFIVSEEVMRLNRRGDIHNNPQELVFIYGSAVLPSADGNHSVNCGTGELGEKLEVGLAKFLVLDPPAVVIAQW